MPFQTMKDFIHEDDDTKVVANITYSFPNKQVNPYRYIGTDMQTQLQKAAIQTKAVEQAYHIIKSPIWTDKVNFVARHGSSIAGKLLAQYEPMIHVVGVKAVGLNLKDIHTGTVQYPASGLVTCKDFNGQANCGGGLHWSFAHDGHSMVNTITRKKEVEARFQLALLPADRTLVVDNNKFKAPAALVIHTGSFKEIFDALKQSVFGDALRSYAAENIVTLPTSWS